MLRTSFCLLILLGAPRMHFPGFRFILATSSVDRAASQPDTSFNCPWQSLAVFVKRHFSRHMSFASAATRASFSVLSQASLPPHELHAASPPPPLSRHTSSRASSVCRLLLTPPPSQRRSGRKWHSTVSAQPTNPMCRGSALLLHIAFRKRRGMSVVYIP